MKIKIISDGKVHGTKVVNAETGETIEGITGIEWSIEVGQHEPFSIVVIKAMDVQLELVGDAALQILPAYEAMALLQGRTKLEGVNEA